MKGQNRRKKIITRTALVILIIILIYNIPPIIITSQGLLFGAKIENKNGEILKQNLLKEERFFAPNAWDHFWLISFGLFKDIKIKQLYVAEQVKSERKALFLYGIKASNKEEEITAFEIQYGNETYSFRYVWL